jgi:pimeloyl-ACP methyl ester carboxylesterase
VSTSRRVAGLDDTGVGKAALFGRLLVDWQLSDPIHRGASEPPPVAWGAVGAGGCHEGGIGESLLTDPSDYLTRVTCPVLAFFGEDDVVQPSETSARLIVEYLATAGNQDVTIVTLPDVGHDIDWTTPGYSDMVSASLRSHDRW